jgi:hypothetical protein
MKMKQTVILVLSLFLAASLLAQQHVGLEPRAKASDYPVVQEQSEFTLGAAQIPSKQVRRTFVSNIGKQYVVVEVGVFPKGESKLSVQDFVLRVQGEKDMIRPAEPQVMAAKINQKDQSGHDLVLYPSVGIGYQTGNDPYSGRGKGWSTSSGVVGDVQDRKKSPKTAAADEKAMTAELTEKSLPEIKTSKPIAGYLYFPVPTDKQVAYQLEYQGPYGTVTLPLPIPAN